MQLRSEMISDTTVWRWVGDQKQILASRFGDTSVGFHSEIIQTLRFGGEWVDRPSSVGLYLVNVVDHLESSTDKRERFYDPRIPAYD